MIKPNDEFYSFTSESVSEGHPDKIADQISDAILDACLEKDKNSRVAVETLITKNLIIIAGEVTTKAKLNIESIAKTVLKEIGYDDITFGFDLENAKIITSFHEQSEEIAKKMEHGKKGELFAGDQGMMFGFATDETEESMPLPITVAHALQEELKKCRKEKILPYLGPDAKSQVTVLYKNQKPFLVSDIVLSTQHKKDVTQEKLQKDLFEMIQHVIPKNLLSEKTRYLINPAGPFVIGGPLADTGLTGRKIMVDTYGGMGRHGGGAFSGKDPTKLDRSAAYMARLIAKNIVRVGLATKCEIEIAYAIGIKEPISLYVNTFQTGKIRDVELQSLVLKTFDLTPQGIIDFLDLQKPIYQKTASGGHYGRSFPLFSWERDVKLFF